MTINQNLDNPSDLEAVANANDPDMILSEAVAQVLAMQKQRKWGESDDAVNFKAFFEKWGSMTEEEKSKSANDLAEIASRVAAGPGPITPPQKITSLDYAVVLLANLNPPVIARLAAVIAEYGLRRPNDLIIPGKTEPITVSWIEPGGKHSQITEQRSVYDPIKVNSLLTRMSNLTFTPIPASSTGPIPPPAKLC